MAFRYQPICEIISESKKIFENFFSLSILQIADYVFPLITVSYLVRVLGPEKFGLLAFVQAFIHYFNVLTDYGFNLSATREISIYRNDRGKIAELFNSVMLIKVFLLVLAFSIMISIVFLFSRFRKNWILYFFSFGTVVGQTFFPVWFFQGMEKMRYITIFSVASRIFFTICIFIFIKDSSNYIYVPLINATGLCISAIFSLLLVVRKFGIYFTIPSMKLIKHIFVSGWHIFVSTLVINLYASSRVFMVGLLTNNKVTGYYAISEKLVKVIQAFPIVSVLRSMYPRLSSIFQQSPIKAYVLSNYLQWIVFIFYSIAIVFFFIFSGKIVHLVAGCECEEIILSFRILLLGVLAVNGNAFRVHFFLVSGRQDIYFRIHLLLSMVGIPLLFFLISSIGYIGAPISVVILEFLILLYSIYEMKGLEKFLTVTLSGYKEGT